MDGAARPGPMRIQLPPPFDPTTVSPPAGVHFAKDDPSLPTLHNLNSPYYNEVEKNNDYLDSAVKSEEPDVVSPSTELEGKSSHTRSSTFSKLSIKRSMKSSSTFSSKASATRTSTFKPSVTRQATSKSYTSGLKQEPAKPWVKTLNPWNGRLSHESWWRAAIRPFILFAYPAVLWSALVYSLSVGWLIVLSESVAAIYENRGSYNFTPLQVGLVYMSPFIGGILGTAVAGKFSDVIVRFMARRNHGIYEPEFRLVMAIPIAITTAIGLMGFGWSAEERDAWIVPTIFFGVISFGCSLGSTTAITFCVDSYRQYAGEALVTLNFSKNILHGLVWSLFFPHCLGLPDSADDTERLKDTEKMETLRSATVLLTGLSQEGDNLRTDDLKIVRHGLCFRPVSDNGRPIVSKVPEHVLGHKVKMAKGGGVFIASGHGPWGISLSLGTGQVVAEMLLGRKLSANIARLSLR